MAMEEDKQNLFEIRSYDIDKAVHPKFFELNKKRKLQAEQLGLPLPKHKCGSRSFSSDCVYPTNGKTKARDFHLSIMKGKALDGTRDDDLEQESVMDSNSFTEDSDSSMTASVESKMDSANVKTCPSDWASTLTAEWGTGSNDFKKTLYSLDSRSFRRFGDHQEEPAHIMSDYNFPLNDFELHASQNFDEHLQEYGGHVDYGCLEPGIDCIDDETAKELEDLLYSNEAPPNNYVLTSGRWNVNQESQKSAKKLTIDKEFEQYFSMLML